MINVHPTFQLLIDEALRVVPDDAVSMIENAGAITSFIAGQEQLYKELDKVRKHYLDPDLDPDDDDDEQALEKAIIEVFITHFTYQIGLVNVMLETEMIEFTNPPSEEEE